MTLHDAMMQVLKEGGRSMTVKEIADAINKKGLYQRGDGTPLPSSQISARANNYPALFCKENGLIALI